MTRHEDARVGGGGMHYTPAERGRDRLAACHQEARRTEQDHARRMATFHGPREHVRPCPACEGAGGPCGWCYGTGREA